MSLQKELEILKSLMGGKDTEAFEKHADFIRENFTSELDQREIDQFMSKVLSGISGRTEELIKESEIRLQLMEVREIVSLSYVAKNYFHKTRTWLYQKINGNIKNGKPCSFTDEELNTLNFALKDISQKLGSIAIFYSN
jgi:hypothetical protein